MTPTLETQRLWLQPLQVSDAQQIQVIFPQWEIVRFLAGRVPWPYPPDGAINYIRDIALPASERGEAWHWTLRLKSDPATIIGSISLMKQENHNRGFWIGLSWQGQGFMSEACDAVTDYWFEVLNFPILRTRKAIKNAASRRLSVSQGMRVVSTEENEYVSGRLLSETWEITAEEWRAGRLSK
jgi:RimJ/RimL family protein N-acetyltransferase